MSKSQERITASRITPGVVIAVEKRGDYLVTTRRVRDVIHATVTDKAVATLPGSGKRGYAITTDHGAVEPCQGIQTFQLITAPTVPAGAPNASAVVVAGTVVAMVEHHDLVTSPVPVPTCPNPYDHRPGTVGCPITVVDCHGIPTDVAGAITERPVTSPAATGADEIAQEIAGHLAYRFTVGPVAIGYTDQTRNRGVREVSTWSTTADGHTVTALRYTGRATDLSTMKDYVSVLVDGVPAGTAKTVEPADIARVARDHIMDLPAAPVAESTPAPAGDQVDDVPAIGSRVLVTLEHGEPFVSTLEAYRAPAFMGAGAGNEGAARGWFSVKGTNGAYARVTADQVRPAPPATVFPGNGRMVKTPDVGAHVWHRVHGVCEVTAVGGRNGETITARSASNGETLSLSRPFGLAWCVVPAPAVDQVDTPDLGSALAALIGDVDPVPAGEPAGTGPAPVDQVDTPPAGDQVATGTPAPWSPYPMAAPDFTDTAHPGPWLVLVIPHGADPSPIIGQKNPHWLTQGQHDSRAVATRQAVTLAASGQWGGVRVTRRHEGDTVAEWYASNTTGWNEWGELSDRGWIERAQDELNAASAGDQDTAPAGTWSPSQIGSVRVQLIDGAGNVVRDFTRPTWARGIRASEREVYAIGAGEGRPYYGEEATRTGEPGTVTDTYRRVWRSSFAEITAVVTRPAPAVTHAPAPVKVCTWVADCHAPAVAERYGQVTPSRVMLLSVCAEHNGADAVDPVTGDQVDTAAPTLAESTPEPPAVTVTIEERPSGTPKLAPSADAPYVDTYSRYQPALSRPDVPAGMPYVIDAPADWDGPVVQLEPKHVAAMLRGKRGFLAAWFPGGRFSVTTGRGCAIDVRWMGGPAADLVDLVAKMWQGKDRDSQAECDRYRGTVLYVAPNGTETAYRLPGEYVFTRRERDTAPADLEAARRFVPADPGREFTYGEVADPYGRPFFGGSADEAARWMSERGITQWTRTHNDPRPVCPVTRCAEAAGHPYPGMHRDDYGHAFLATLPTDDGDQGDGGNGGTPTDVDPVGPAPAGDQVEPAGDTRPSFSTWEELAAHIGTAGPVIEPARYAITAPGGEGADVTSWPAPAAPAVAVSFTCPAHGAVPVPVDIDGGDARRIRQEHQQCTAGDPFGLHAIEQTCTPAAQMARTLRAAGWSEQEIERANDVRPLYMVTNDAHGRVRVHAVTCQDIARDVRREGVTVGNSWEVRADHVRDIVCDLYDDATPETWREFLDLEVMPCAGDLDESDDTPAPAVDQVAEMRAKIRGQLEAEAASLIDQAEQAGAEMHADGMECAPGASGAFARISSAVSVDSAETMRPRLRDAFVRGYQAAADRAAETPAVPVRPGQIATVRGWSGATIFVTGVTADQVIGIESGGTTARVGRHMVTAVKDLASTPTVAELADVYLSDRVSDDVREGLEVLAAGKSAGDLGDSAALIEEGPDDAPYHVVHTKEGGTTVHGSSRGDGVWEVLKKYGRPGTFGGSLYLRNTRNKLAVPSRIRSIGADIAAATGCTVRVVVDNRAADVLAREADRKERADATVEKWEARATRSTVEAVQMREHAHKLTEGIPMGQPVLMDHYSAGKHMRTLDRSDNARRKSFKAADRADYAASKAAGAADNEEAKSNPRAMIRRRERLEEEARGIVRRYEGEPNPDTINGQRLAELREEIAIITGRLDALAKSGEFVAWTRDDFKPGDEVNAGGHWHRVIRANPKSVTVPWWASTTPDTDTKGDTTPYDRIHGRRRDGWQIDTPTGEPWPVSDAKRVARWLTLTAEAGRPHSEQDARERRLWVRIAERIGYGLDELATESEVEAYRLKDERLRTRAGRRAWYLQLLGIFERLEAGETAGEIAASIQAADVTPAWTMPAGVPVDVRVDQLRRGDIVAGYWNTGGLSARGLMRHFAGPVAWVSKIDNRREHGDWVTVRLVDGTEKEFKSHEWFATYPQGRPTVKVADLVDGQRADIRGRDQFGKPSRAWGYVSAPSEFREGTRNRAGELTGHPVLGVVVKETPSGLGGTVMQIFTERDAWCAVLDEREPAPLDPKALADEAGEAAYRTGRTRAPAIDATVRELIAGLPVGGGSTAIMEAFTRGYDRAADEAARLVLAGADK